MNCNNCGNPVAEGAKFCVGCGQAVTRPPSGSFCVSCGGQLAPGAAFCPKCGQALSPSRAIQPAPQVAAPVFTPPAVVAAPMSVVAVRFQCPYCSATTPPREMSQTSSAGWVLFVLLTLTTCVLGPIGFLLQEKYRVCGSCGNRLS